MIPPIMASISRKSSNKVPIIIFRCYIMGDDPIIIQQFFYGFEGVIMGSIMGSQNIMGSIMGSQNIMGSDYGSYISEQLHCGPIYNSAPFSPDGILSIPN
jgi:hypothetical protein